MYSSRKMRKKRRRLRRSLKRRRCRHGRDRWRWGLWRWVWCWRFYSPSLLWSWISPPVLYLRSMFRRGCSDSSSLRHGRSFFTEPDSWSSRLLARRIPSFRPALSLPLASPLAVRTLDRLHCFLVMKRWRFFWSNLLIFYFRHTCIYELPLLIVVITMWIWSCKLPADYNF